MTSCFFGLSPEDRAALSSSVNDLSDIGESTRARLDAGVQRAYETAQGIASGTLNPLTH
jgi:hypothetical protein